ncbi:MAG: scaffolding protein [Bacteroidetes bacterium]|jgi:hypothetical protein|nr:scaffolding protein [Bacteroidota bacterium]
MPDFRSESTPNPNSLKITTDAGPFIEEGMASFNAVAEAEGHPLGGPILRIPGVDNVFILPQFLTITKQPAATWENVLPKVKQVLRSHFEQD